MSGLVLRILLVMSLLGSAAVHLVEWRAWASGNDIVGPLFLLNVVAGIGIAAGVIAWRHWLPPLAAFGFGAATLVAYLLALTVGLFGVEQQFATSAEFWGVVTDVACMLFAGLLLFRRDWRPVATRDAA